MLLYRCQEDIVSFASRIQYCIDVLVEASMIYWVVILLSKLEALLAQICKFNGVVLNFCRRI